MSRVSDMIIFLGYLTVSILTFATVAVGCRCVSGAVRVRVVFVEYLLFHYLKSEHMQHAPVTKQYQYD